MCQHAVSRRDFFGRLALGSMAGASILDLAWRRAWAQAMAPGAVTDLFEIQHVAVEHGILVIAGSANATVAELLSLQ